MIIIAQYILDVADNNRAESAAIIMLRFVSIFVRGRVVHWTIYVTKKSSKWTVKSYLFTLAVLMLNEQHNGPSI
jgi:hypothetical protein